MRVIALLMATAFTAAVQVQEVREPGTGEAFPATLRVGDQSLPCTSLSHAEKLGYKYLAMAHYGDAGLIPEGASPEEKRRLWQTTDTSKAVIMRFTEDIGQKRVQKMCARMLDRVAYEGSNRASFIEALSVSCPSGSELRYLASADGTLRVLYGEKVLGEWKDRALIKAAWANWARHDARRHAEGAVSQTPRS